MASSPWSTDQQPAATVPIGHPDPVDGVFGPSPWASPTAATATPETPPARSSLGSRVAAVLGAVVLAGATVIGVRAGTAHDNATVAAGGNPVGAGLGGNAAGRNAIGTGDVTVGTLTAVDGSTLTLTTAAGTRVTVRTSPSTSVTGRVAGARGDPGTVRTSSVGALAVGETLRVTGATASDGVVTATTISMGSAGAATR